MNMKQKIEEWIDKAPEELSISGIDVERIESKIQSMGERLPILITNGYGITITATTIKYTEE